MTPGARPTFDLQRLGLSRISSAVDILRHETLTVSDAAIAVSLVRHQGRVILLQP